MNIWFDEKPIRLFSVYDIQLSIWLPTRLCLNLCLDLSLYIFLLVSCKLSRNGSTVPFLSYYCKSNKLMFHGAVGWRILSRIYRTLPRAICQYFVCYIQNFKSFDIFFCMHPNSKHPEMITIWYLVYMLFRSYFKMPVFFSLQHRLTSRDN